VLPGSTRTGRLDAIMKRKATAADVPQSEIEAKAQAEIPLRRFADAAEIGGVVAFLASPAAGYITGVSIPVDGGRLHCV
jgi:3-oxoacyl-[acyl-carrier protein] reductase